MPGDSRPEGVAPPARSTQGARGDVGHRAPRAPRPPHTPAPRKSGRRWVPRCTLDPPGWPSRDTQRPTAPVEGGTGRTTSGTDATAEPNHHDGDAPEWGGGGERSQTRGTCAAVLENPDTQVLSGRLGVKVSGRAGGGGREPQASAAGEGRALRMHLPLTVQHPRPFDKIYLTAASHSFARRVDRARRGGQRSGDGARVPPRRDAGK